jgi:integrase
MISPMHDLARALDFYEGELTRAGRSVATRRKYRDVLEPFCHRYRDKSLQEITVDDCRSYLDTWTSWREPRRGTRSARPPASAATLALYVSVLRGFFSFCETEGWIVQNPMTRVMRPRRLRPEDTHVVSVSEKDVERLLNACQTWDEILCFAVLCYAGPRRTAAARVRRCDVSLERRTIRFSEKGGKVITKELADELAAIIRAADELGVWKAPSSPEYLIPNRRPAKNRERSPKVIYAIVKRVADRAGVDVHPHALRAAFAVQFHDQHPGHVTALKELLGHSRVETTYVYLRRVEKARAMEAVRDLSWRWSMFPPSEGMPPAGFEPALREDGVPEPLRRKLEELRTRSDKARRP